MEKIKFSPILLEKSKYKKCFLLWTNWESFKNHFDEKWDEILVMEDKIEKYVNNAKDNKCYKNNVKENLSNYKRDIEYKLSENDIHIDLSLVAITLAILAFFIPFLSDEFFSFLSEARLLESSLLISDNVVKWLEIFLFLLSVVILVKLFRLLLKGNKVRYDIRLLEFQLEIVNKYLNTIS